MAKKLKTAAGARYLLLAENLPIESLAPRLARLDIRDEHRLHLARKKYSHEVLELIHRLLRGIALPEQAPFIVDAWTEENNLVVLSPSFQRLTVPFAKLSAFLGDDPTRMSEFEIDEDGSFLHWGHADVHLGWEQLLHLVDPAAALLAKQRARDFNRHYGAAIRALREQRGIKQSEVAGLTDRHLRRIELGQQTVTKSALEALAAAHQMSTNVYMDALAKRIT